MKAKQPSLRKALQRLKSETEALFTLADDSIVDTGDGWCCKSCGMELDTGGTHKSDCLASRILDLSDALKESEDSLKTWTPKGPARFCRNCQGPIDEHTTSCEACGATDFET